MQCSMELTQSKEIYTVTRLNQEVRILLEDNFATVWIEGEISNFATPPSGHWYFSLKDANAQVRCAMFKPQNRRVNFAPRDGMHILINARVSLYENRGDFQLIAEDMEERGEGKLRRAFDALKKKLESAGLFDAKHKKALPLFPTTIGVITSATGAAIRDILTVLKRRFPCVPVIIYPTLVQGEAAATGIVQALETANRRQECDILILARGGGSLEDLWPFNEEMVAYAIHKSAIPIISGVGHEIDFTIADFVADKRAPTPSAAAEIVTPDKLELLQLLLRHQKQIERHLKQQFSFLTERLRWIQKNLFQQHPKRQFAEKMQQLDYHEQSIIQLHKHRQNNLQHQLRTLTIKFENLQPRFKIHTLRAALEQSEQKLKSSIVTYLSTQCTQVEHAAGKLEGLSPHATLKRGYAIAIRRSNHKILKDCNHINPGEDVEIKLHQGSLDCKVITIAK